MSQPNQASSCLQGENNKKRNLEEDQSPLQEFSNEYEESPKQRKLNSEPSDLNTEKILLAMRANTLNKLKVSPHTFKAWSLVFYK